MRAIQLLEQLGANASLQTDDAKKTMVAMLRESSDLEQNHKIWCMMFPEDEEKDKDEGDKDKEQDDKSGSVSH